MKKILIVVPSLGIGGREKIAVNMSDCLKSNNDVKIVVFQSNEQEYTTACNVINIDVPVVQGRLKKYFTQLKRAKRLKKIIKAENADIVFSLGNTANITNALVKTTKKTKKIVAIHGFAEVKKNKINSFIFKKADKIVTISQEMQHRLLQIYPKLNNTAVIENGYKIIDNIDTNNHIYNPEIPKFVSMGRLDKVKGFDRLLKSFAIIVKAIPKAHLSIIGYGPEKENLINLANSLGLKDNVEFLGYCTEPLPLLALNDIYLLTSRNEGFPNCLIEALNCGLAVVAVDCLSGPKEILSEKYDIKPVEGIYFEKYGVLVENYSDESKMVEDFAHAVIELANSESRLLQYKNSGKVRANNFSLEVFKGKLNNLFGEVLR